MNLHFRVLILFICIKHVVISHNCCLCLVYPLSNAHVFICVYDKCLWTFVSEIKLYLILSYLTTVSLLWRNIYIQWHILSSVVFIRYKFILLKFEFPNQKLPITSNGKIYFTYFFT